MVFTIFFRNIKTSNLFITLTDLDNSIIKKNKYVKNYIYYFHGSVSTTKVYTEKLLIIMIQFYVMVIIITMKYS